MPKKIGSKGGGHKGSSPARSRSGGSTVGRAGSRTVTNPSKKEFNKIVKKRKFQSKLGEFKKTSLAVRALKYVLKGVCFSSVVAGGTLLGVRSWVDARNIGALPLDWKPAAADPTNQLLGEGTQAMMGGIGATLAVGIYNFCPDILLSEAQLRERHEKAVTEERAEFLTGEVARLGALVEGDTEEADSSGSDSDDE